MNAPHRALGLAALALLLLGAAPQPELNLVRQGNAAFARKDYKAALLLYQQAEETAHDPGLVAFNKAAVLFKLNRYREAELCYRRCLEDDQVPSPRRLRALYDLGTSLMHVEDGKDVQALEAAVRCLGACRDAEDAELRERAAYNLELARVLLKEAAANPGNPSPRKNEEDTRQENRSDEQPGPKGDAVPAPGKEGSKGQALLQDPTKGQQKAIKTEETTAGKGNLRTLPDSDELAPLDPQDTAAHLAQVARRIRDEQRDQRRLAPGAPPNVKDW
jgi:tetratricopeptide (TPR) repeat protein